ncbi:nucleoplasmin-like protein ANO39 isoform X2 [Hyla sarda]|nr:nucleoplasmin-like protein ANO39 isoform X2 [Hyla sarda]XP_056407984.1 nucleoplasmin-like protein ANO39 isoform X2 [Hyla sarda]
MLKKIAVFAGLSEEVENVGSADPLTPNKRRFLSGKKRIGRLARLILLVTPYRIQYALGYRTGEGIGKTSADDIRKSPLKPSGKGSKRKQDDLDIEEQHSWVAFMAEDFPEEDQEDDPTYEPSNTESDSEENKSDNDTESDLEVEEEEDGNVRLKETIRGETQGSEKQQNASESKESSKDGEDSEQKNPAPTD